MPKVSVLIAVYNGQEHVATALKSVQDQTYRDYETIVIDDGSKDDTAAVVERFPDVRLIRQENSGIGYTRQRLVEEAEGEWLAFLDHDDFWEPTKLERQVEQTDDNVGLVHSLCTYFYPGGLVEPRTWRPPEDDCVLDHLLPDCMVNTGSCLLRRETLLQVGGFDQSLSIAEDWLAWFMMASKTDFRFVPENLSWILRRPVSASTPNVKWYEGERHVLQDLILPRLDELYGRLPMETRNRFRRIAQRKLAVMASLQAEAHDLAGERNEARLRHLEAIKRAPGMRGAWLRYVRHLASPNPKQIA